MKTTPKLLITIASVIILALITAPLVSLYLEQNPNKPPQPVCATPKFLTPDITNTHTVTVKLEIPDSCTYTYRHTTETATYTYDEGIISQTDLAEIEIEIETDSKIQILRDREIIAEQTITKDNTIKIIQEVLVNNKPNELTVTESNPVDITVEILEEFVDESTEISVNKTVLERINANTFGTTLENLPHGFTNLNINVKTNQGFLEAGALKYALVTEPGYMYGFTVLSTSYRVQQKPNWKSEIRNIQNLYGYDQERDFTLFSYTLGEKTCEFNFSRDMGFTTEEEFETFAELAYINEDIGHYMIIHEKGFTKDECREEADELFKDVEIIHDQEG